MRMILSLTAFLLATTTAGFSTEDAAKHAAEHADHGHKHHKGHHHHHHGKKAEGAHKKKHHKGHHHRRHKKHAEGNKHDHDKMHHEGKEKHDDKGKDNKMMDGVHKSSNQQPMPAQNNKLSQASSVLNTDNNFKGDFTRNS